MDVFGSGPNTTLRGVFIWTLWKLSTPQTDRLDDPNYTKAFQLIVHVQLIIFLVDETKIEYLRNPNYQFQPWLMFATLAAGAMILRSQQTPAATARAILAPVPART